MDRRDVLRAAALAPLAPLVAPGTPPPDWARLRGRLAGTLVLPGDAGYATARRLYNPAYDRVRPGGVAYCESAADVSACLAFARDNRVPVTARSGGHSYAGWSTGKGLVIDLSRMRSVAYDGPRFSGPSQGAAKPDPYSDGRATIGAGAKLIDVYDRLSRHDVSVPAGTCPTVGIGGLTLGGGLGVVSRKHGLTCDALESVRVVTADGRVVACDATRNPGLFWACRGGGGGNFGVAVSFTFRTFETGDATVFFLQWPWSKARAVVRAWQSWAPSAPEELWSSLHLARSAGGLSVELAGTYLGRKSSLDRLLAPLVGRAGRPSSRSARTVSHLEAMKIMGGCSSMPVAECRRIPRTTFSAKSHMAYRTLPEDGIRALVNGVARGGRHMVLMDAMGGAIRRVDPTATAFPHRAALFSVQYYQDGMDRSWLRALHADMSQYFGINAYVNYIDPDLENWRTAYYGPNAARLAEVKATYDPGRLFRLPQGL
ncbi:FAD-binding oxidoreductase [Nonomuraea polychroma]|uniref:FAD-binding oxidoreductase n=1 Tax=Nonomuraea polychroma TaxID=46176 RepID=UPI000FDD9A45|nr:FAD-binding oxidoreductase [Nonomuraea polychroma]